MEQGRSFVVVEEAAPAGTTVGEGKNQQKERFVARRYTPGTLCNESWQSDMGNRYLLALSFPSPSFSAFASDDSSDTGGAEIGIAWIDISTDRAVTSKAVALDELEHELTRVSPVEVVLHSAVRGLMEGTEGGKVVDTLKGLLKGTGILVSYVTPRLQAQQGAGEPLAIELITTHLAECLLDHMPRLLPPNHQEQTATMRIDASTLLGLEIRHSLRGSRDAGSPIGRTGTLLSVIKRTLTSSGTRLLGNTLTQPSAHRATIEHRHALVHAFLERPRLREDLRDFLRAQRGEGRGEIVRIVQRFSAGRKRRVARYYQAAGSGGNARDLVDLKERVGGVRWMVERIREEVGRGMRDERVGRLETLVATHRDLQGLVELIDGAVNRGALEKEPEGEPEGEGDESKMGGVWWLNPE